MCMERYLLFRKMIFLTRIDLSNVRTPVLRLKALLDLPHNHKAMNHSSQSGENRSNIALSNFSTSWNANNLERTTLSTFFKLEHLNLTYFIEKSHPTFISPS